MSFIQSVERKDLVYIPYGADKGDCPHCLEGVLERDSTVESMFKVREGYKCDICCRNFIEGIFVVSRKPWEKGVSRRYFMEAPPLQRFEHSFFNNY